MLRRSHPDLSTETQPGRPVGFTLIEVVVCIMVIAILMALLVPAVQQVREAARATECRSKLHQVNLAIHQYLETHRCFPCPVWGDHHSYVVRILSQLDLAPIAADFQAGNSLPHLLRPMPMLWCPSDSHNSESPAISYYMNDGSRFPDENGLGRNGFFGDRGFLIGSRRHRRTVANGHSFGSCFRCSQRPSEEVLGTDGPRLPAGR